MAASASPYPDPNQPPPVPDVSLTSQKARLNPLGRSLMAALTALAEEDDDMSSQPKEGIRKKRPRPTDSSDEVVDINDSDSSILPARVDSEMKEHLLQTFGDAVADTDWYGAVDSSTAFRTSKGRGRAKKQAAREEKSAPAPPAVLMRGKVKHYNRFGGQWRILATDVEIRPRVNFETPAKNGRVRRSAWKRADRESLWDRSLEEDEEGMADVPPVTAMASSDVTSSNTTDSPNTTDGPATSSDLHKLDLKFEGGTVKVKGDVMILAYDDA